MRAQIVAKNAVVRALQLNTRKIRKAYLVLVNADIPGQKKRRIRKGNIYDLLLALKLVTERLTYRMVTTPHRDRESNELDALAARRAIGILRELDACDNVVLTEGALVATLREIIERLRIHMVHNPVYKGDEVAIVECEADEKALTDGISALAS